MFCIKFQCKKFQLLSWPIAQICISFWKKNGKKWPEEERHNKIEKVRDCLLQLEINAKKPLFSLLFFQDKKIILMDRDCCFYPRAKNNNKTHRNSVCQVLFEIRLTGIIVTDAKWMEIFIYIDYHYWLFLFLLCSNTKGKYYFPTFPCSGYFSCLNSMPFI